MKWNFLFSFFFYLDFLVPKKRIANKEFQTSEWRYQSRLCALTLHNSTEFYVLP